MAPSSDDDERMAAAAAGGDDEEPAAASSGGGDSTEEEDDMNSDGDSADDSGSNEEESNSDDDGSGDDDEDDSDDEGVEAMEVEAIPTEDNDEDNDATSTGTGRASSAAGSPAKAAAAPIPPPPPPVIASEERRTTPKMRIKLSLKARAAAAAAAAFDLPALASASAPSQSVAAPASAQEVQLDSAVKPKATVLASAAADGEDADVAMAEAHDVGDISGGDGDGGEMIATAEVVEDAAPSFATDTATPSRNMKTPNKPSTSPAAPSSTTSLATKLMDSHPLHKPSRQRAPPPSLSRPMARNPQLAYTSTRGQGGGYHTRAVRLPSMLSPGMLAAPNASNAVGTAVGDTEVYRMLHDGDKDKEKGTAAGGGPDTGGSKEDPYENYMTAESVFAYYMATQGYTPESRSTQPHRGSSIVRTVGDMFDNDVVSSINFPNMLPDYLRSRRGGAAAAKKEKDDEDKDKGGEQEASTPMKDVEATMTTPDRGTTAKDGQVPADAATTPDSTPTSTPKTTDGSPPPTTVRMDAMDMLKFTLTSVLEKRKAASSSSSSTTAVTQGAAKKRKQFRPLQFQDMVPVSLTFPYPGEYTRARKEYAQKVQEREDAIKQDQTNSQKASDLMETYNRERARWEEKLTQWETDKAEHKERLVQWERDQAERRERFAQWEKGRAEVEEAAAALAKKSASPPKSDASSPPADAEAKSPIHVQGEEKEKREGEGVTTTEAKDSGEGDEQAEEPVLGPKRPETPQQPKEPVLPPLPAPMAIPPIPVSPSPPSWDDAASAGIHRSSPETLKRYATDLAHLDPATYLSTVPTPRARYVGLSSNSISDANFVGPAASGIAGIGLGLGSGLSTAYSGASGGQGGGGLHSSSYYEGLKRFADHMGYSDVNKASPSKKKSSSPKNNSTSPSGSAGKDKKKEGKIKLPKITLKMPQLPPKLKGDGISSSELKGMFETGGPDTEEMRVTIIKATVYAARVGKAAGDKFVGSDDKVYSGVGKAFSNFAGIKPCERCRKSKQGALMCRVRRKHRDEDYDGSNSYAVLQQYFKADLTTLIRKPPADPS